MRPGFSGEPDTNLGVEIVVQQHIAGLQVHVEQGRGETVEEIYTQSYLVSQSEDQWPRQSSANVGLLEKCKIYRFMNLCDWSFFLVLCKTQIIIEGVKVHCKNLHQTTL